MGLKFINVVLILIVHEILSTSALAGDEIWKMNPEMEEECRFYTSSLAEENQENIKIIKDLREKLVRQEINEALIKELRSQIDLQKGIIDNLSSNMKVAEKYGKCKDELANTSKKLKKIKRQLEKCETDKETSGKPNDVDLPLEESKKIIQQKENDLKLCQIEVERLKKLESQTVNSNLFASYEKCRDELLNKTSDLRVCDIQTHNLNSSLSENNKELDRIRNELRDLNNTILINDRDLKSCRKELRSYIVFNEQLGKNDDEHH